MSIEHLGLDYKKVNPNGGAIALGVRDQFLSVRPLRKCTDIASRSENSTRSAAPFVLFLPLLPFPITDVPPFAGCPPDCHGPLGGQALGRQDHLHVYVHRQRHGRRVHLHQRAVAPSACYTLRLCAHAPDFEPIDMKCFLAVTSVPLLPPKPLMRTTV